MTDTLTLANVGAKPNREARFPLGAFDRKPSRHITREWSIREDGDSTITVQLDCFHFGSGRTGKYVANVNNARHYPDGTRSCMPMSATRLLAEPCERYSKPVFEAFANRALAHLRDAVENGGLVELLAGELAPIR